MAPTAFVSSTLPALKTRLIRTTSTSAPTPVTYIRPLTHVVPQAPFQTPTAQPPSPPGKPTRVLYWFHNDLRVHDNPALHEAINRASRPGGALVPLHFITKSSQTAAAELKHSLESLGSSLLTLSGNVEQSILDVCEKLKLRAVIFNRSVLRSHVALEKRVTGRLQSAGIHVEGFWSNSLPLSESMFSAKNIDLPAVRKHIAKAKHVTDMVAPPEKMPALPSVVASIKQISLAARVGGGTSAALKLLGSMNRRRECLTVSAETDLAITLKTHMDLGAISPRMIANKVQCIVKSLDGATFSELVWRAYASAVYHRAVGVKYSRAVAV